ncbi:TonB family protein, partial [Rhodosalinus sp. FB01]|uniref:TonB family protein n=2 Tax=unclassified Rhodosalinus TaxID=2630183 RepID=UPI003524ED45
RAAAAAPARPAAEAAPRPDTRAAIPSSPHAPGLSRRPAPRPETLETAPARSAARPSPAPAARPAPPEAPTGGRGAAPQSQQAEGAGGGASAGRTRATEQAAQGASGQKLVARWGGQIVAAIERQKRYPSGTRAAGRVRLAILVAPAGRLAGVSVRGSSGNAQLDRAAVAAVQRARLPRAPNGLSSESYPFTVTLRFAP